MVECRSVVVDGYRCLLAPAVIEAVGPAADLGEVARSVLARTGIVATLRDRPRRIEVVRLGSVPALEVVIKEFRGDTWRARWDRALGGDDRAERCWKVAHALIAAGIGTAAPLLLATPISPTDRRPSYFGCRHLGGALEVRAVVDALNRGRPLPPNVAPDLGPLFHAIGRLARRLHQAGIWHRDLTAGNLLLWPWPDERATLHLVDLDRARLARRIGRMTRVRELGRFPIRAGPERGRFLSGYHDPDPIPLVEAALDAIHHRVYRFRKWARYRSKRWLRRLLGSMSGDGAGSRGAT